MNTLTVEAAAAPETTLPLSIPPTLSRVVLTGFMGAGKSTVGRGLAAALGWKFLDLDDLIEELAGISIPEIFATLGELHLRRLESRALARALRLPHTVIALGGGAPETLTNRLLIEQTPNTVAIFLDAPFPTLFDRCMLQALNPSATARPNLADPVLAEARFRLRHPIYRRLARHTVDTTTLSLASTVPAIVALLQTSK